MRPRTALSRRVREAGAQSAAARAAAIGQLRSLCGRAHTERRARDKAEHDHGACSELYHALAASTARVACNADTKLKEYPDKRHELIF